MNALLNKPVLHLQTEYTRRYYSDSTAINTTNSEDVSPAAETSPTEEEQGTAKVRIDIALRTCVFACIEKSSWLDTGRDHGDGVTLIIIMEKSLSVTKYGLCYAITL
jgi:hypothetical protein